MAFLNPRHGFPQLAPFDGALLAEPISRKPEARAEGMRFLDHTRDFPQLALRALKNGGVLSGD